MSTLSQFLGGGGIKSIQRGSTAFEGTSASNITTITVPINPVVRSKSVVIATVAGDSLLRNLSPGRDADQYVVQSSSAAISLGSGTIASDLIIGVGKGFADPVIPAFEFNQSGVISWQVIEYE